MTRIAVIGTGYVGLTTGACLSDLGHRVVCHDVDDAKIAMLSGGTIPIVEPGLERLVSSGLGSSDLRFTTDLGVAVEHAEIVFLCVPTPQGDDGSADLSFVFAAVDSLTSLMASGTILVNKSTVPVGTAAVVRERLGRSDIHVVSNPEFLRQGSAVTDFMEPTRVVVGGDDEGAVEMVASLYSATKAPILRMKTESAEALKYAANAFLATKLTFINAMADICEAVGADIFDVAEGIGLDPRIGYDMLRAGPGWGGSCFPKDTRALVNIAARGGYDFALLRGVIETNDRHYERIVDKVEVAVGGSVSGKIVAAWGLTFKANTDDLRDSPAIKILRILHERGAVIRSFEPTAKGPYAAHPWLPVVTSIEETVEGADVVVLLTEWDIFRDQDPEEVGRHMRVRAVVDARNHLDRGRWLNAGFTYRGVGR